MTITSPVFSAGVVLTNTSLNNAFALLTAEINSQAAQILALTAPTAPDLSGYVTQSQLTTHVNAAAAHPGFVKLAGTAATKQAYLQSKLVALDGSGNGTATWDQSYATGAVLGAWPDLENAAAAAVSVSSITNTGAVVKGPASQNVRVYAIGWF